MKTAKLKHAILQNVDCQNNETIEPYYVFDIEKNDIIYMCNPYVKFFHSMPFRSLIFLYILADTDSNVWSLLEELDSNSVLVT